MPTEVTSQWQQSCFKMCWISFSTPEILLNSLCKERIFVASGFATNHTNKLRNVKWKHWELGCWVGPQSIVEKNPKFISLTISVVWKIWCFYDSKNDTRMWSLVWTIFSLCWCYARVQQQDWNALLGNLYSLFRKLARMQKPSLGHFSILFHHRFQCVWNEIQSPVFRNKRLARRWPYDLFCSGSFDFHSMPWHYNQ